jgi:hypothetical protein
VSKTVDYTPGTSFAVDGVAATRAAFAAAVGVGDKLSFSGTSFSLTNVTVTSGLVDDVDFVATTYDVVVASGAVAVTNEDYTPVGTTTYTVGGTAATQATFEASLSDGDTVAKSGTGSATSPFVFALTNGSVTGLVSGLAGDKFAVTTAGGAAFGGTTFFDNDVPGTDAFVLTLGGTAVSNAAFDAALSNGDAVVVSRAAGISTYALTNAAPAAVTGRVLTFDSGVGTNTISLAVGTTTVAVPNYAAAGATMRLNSAGAVEVDIDGAINIGDEVVYQAADAATTTAQSINLNDKPVSGTPVALVTGVAGTVTIKFTATGPASATISTVTATPANIVNAGLSGNTTVEWRVNGTAGTQGAWEAAVNGITTGGLTGTVSVSDSGVNTVWNVTTP